VIVYHSCGQPLLMETSWNGLTYVVELYTADSELTRECPRCGEGGLTRTDVYTLRGYVARFGCKPGTE